MDNQIQAYMAKDQRYKTLKVMIDTGNISALEDIFNIIPKTVVAADLGINYSRFLTRLTKPAEFTLDELMRLATFIEIDSKTIIHLVLADIEKKKVGRKKR